ncbi:MAG: hypothetical protein Q7U54_21150 [Bacteroidales bacterium]|nr:hypothetical protein [Bacteroidales bacterium]
MKNKIFLFVFFISFFSQSCNDRYRNETISFQNYLSNTFKQKIPEVEHIYLLVSRFGCPNCIDQALIKISEKTVNKQEIGITIVTYDTTLVSKTFIKRAKILFDNNAEYETILPIANLALIKTERGKISKIKILNLDEMEKIIGEEF